MQSIPLKSTQTQVLVNDFVRSVYNWMALGLGLTGFIAFYVSNSPDLIKMIFGNQILFFGLIIGELGLVFYLSARVQKIQASTATALFILYAASATFVSCSIYGMVTKRDLTSLGGFMAMGLIGIIIASVVNMFIRSSGMSLIISYIGVFVFVGLTAYDTQKLKRMALAQPSDLEAGVVRKGAIMGALTLYLDFINLFLMLLRILGDRR
ncbi:MAG: Bax inhibitor-1/YccA family protein [Deltaproteobacteria bacterium]|nr:Bax inhibitor-1/YccA family protein [Deltaproteobacteria bacterium]